MKVGRKPEYLEKTPDGELQTDSMALAKFLTLDREIYYY